MLRKTRIVCTIGPASSSRQMIGKMIRGGMNVARINLSHGNREEHAEVISTIQEVAAALKKQVAVLLDLPGPKPRTGVLKQPQLLIKRNDKLTLTSDDILGDACRISVDFPTIFCDAEAGDTIFLNDGAIQLKVLSVTSNEVNCRVVVGGLLSDHRGINVPGKKLSIPSVTS